MNRRSFVRAGIGILGAAVLAPVTTLAPVEVIQSQVNVHRAQTVEELSDEMNRWLRGEKDFHDQVIDAYKQQILAKLASDRALAAKVPVAVKSSLVG